MKRITRAIVPSALLVCLAFGARATAQALPTSSKPCKKTRGNACPPEESARASTTVVSAEPLTRAAALLPGGLRGRSADDAKLSQCLDKNGTPLMVHSHNGHLYSYVPTMKFESWHDALMAANNLSCCQAKGRLLVVNDDSEREFVKSSVVPTSSTGWIGLVDEANDGVWRNVAAAAAAAAAAATASSPDISDPGPEDSIGGNAGENSPVDCGSDSNYDDKDYMYGVRCREAEQLAIIVEFDCSEGRR